jgi:hypothetical protein
LFKIRIFGRRGKLKGEFEEHELRGVSGQTGLNLAEETARAKVGISKMGFVLSLLEGIKRLSNVYQD